MKTINLDLQYLGQDSGLTYAVIGYDNNGKSRSDRGWGRVSKAKD